jgi:hypothetical protein
VKGLSYFPVHEIHYDLKITECIYVKNVSSEGKSLMWWGTVRGKNKLYGLEGVMDQIILFFCVIKTNLMHYLSSVYSVNQLLHVSGIFVAHHQEVYCIYTTTGTCCAF